MKTRDTSTRATRWMTILPVIAVSALLAGLPAARAQNFNQQATAAEQDDATNWQAAKGAAAAYARAPWEFQRAPISPRD